MFRYFLLIKALRILCLSVVSVITLLRQLHPKALHSVATQMKPGRSCKFMCATENWCRKLSYSPKRAYKRDSVIEYWDVSSCLLFFFVALVCFVNKKLTFVRSLVQCLFLYGIIANIKNKYHAPPFGTFWSIHFIYIYIQWQLKKSYLSETNNWTQNKTI